MNNPQKASGKYLWKKILWPEKNFYFVTFIYAIGTSLLSLAIPISVQSLVNTVTFAVLKQPLIVVSVLLLGLLIFSGVLRALQDLTVEYFQRHFYARLTVHIADKILTSTQKSVNSVYKGDLVNRYFEIMSIQKQSTKLLIDGITLVLQTIAGMFLLAFYHPYFLAFDIVLIGLIYLMWKLYGKAGIETSIYESKAKYKAAAWLEELIYNRHMFYGRKSHQSAIKATDGHINLYLTRRFTHFNYLFKQIIFSLCIYALMSALILGLGGFLVMEGQLTLGQLVSAEIVVALILTGIAKSGGYLESFYDIYAALDKLEDFEILQSEKELPQLEEQNSIGDGPLVFDNIAIENENKEKYHFHHSFQKGSCYHIVIDKDCTQRTFMSLLHAHNQPKTGDIIWSGIPYEDIPLMDLREEIYLVDAPRIIQGSILDNLTWSVDKVTESQLNHAVDATLLSEKINNLPEGLETQIWHGCSLFRWGELIQLEFARVLLQKPKWVVISSLFNQLRPELQKAILIELKGQNIGVMVLSFSHDEFEHCKLLFDEKLEFHQDYKKSPTPNP
ncbi:MAG: hypothetical protein CME63_07840 [Halobacteriovoraceae bacterium]|nr:hypothetical protein [Halobacteriovoraceae bacterium]|tara:strand:+ start:7362 stop:9038 length:1677 start_codon:yes stop_codon:yes gene_type:complete